MGNKEQTQCNTIFSNYSNGLKTQRDAWAYNASRQKLASNMGRMIDFYNSEVKRFDAAHPGLPKKAREEKVDDFINTDPGEISWTRALKGDLAKGNIFSLDPKSLTHGTYRPYTKQWMYFNRRFNEMVYQIPKIFPSSETGNKIISIAGVGARAFSTLMSDQIPCLDSIEKGQCFLAHLYEGTEGTSAVSSRFTPSCQPDKPQLHNLAICLTLSGTKGFSVLMTDSVPDLHMVGDAQCFPMFLYDSTEDEA